MLTFLLLVECCYVAAAPINLIAYAQDDDNGGGDADNGGGSPPDNSAPAPDDNAPQPGSGGTMLNGNVTTTVPGDNGDDPPPPSTPDDTDPFASPQDGQTQPNPPEANPDEQAQPSEPGAYPPEPEQQPGEYPPAEQNSEEPAPANPPEQYPPEQSPQDQAQPSEPDAYPPEPEQQPGEYPPPEQNTEEPAEPHPPEDNAPEQNPAQQVEPPAPDETPPAEPTPDEPGQAPPQALQGSAAAVPDQSGETPPDEGTIPPPDTGTIPPPVGDTFNTNTSGEPPADATNENPEPSNQTPPDQYGTNPAGSPPLDGNATTEDTTPGAPPPASSADNPPLEGNATTEDTAPPAETPQTENPATPPDQYGTNPAGSPPLEGSANAAPPDNGPDLGPIPPPEQVSTNPAPDNIATNQEAPSGGNPGPADQPQASPGALGTNPPSKLYQGYAQTGPDDPEANLSPAQAAEVDQTMDAAQQLAAAIQQGGQNGLYATDQFFKGMTDFFMETGAFLNQPQHVPALRIAQAIQKYLTGDAYANNAATLAAAQKAVAEFQKNPAYFAGHNTINAVLTAQGMGAGLAAMRARVAAEVAQGGTAALSAGAADTLAAAATEATEMNAAEEGVELGSTGAEFPDTFAQGPNNPLGFARPEQFMSNNPFGGGKNCLPLSVARAIRQKFGGIRSPEDLTIQRPDGTTKRFLSDEITPWADTQALFQKYLANHPAITPLNGAERVLRLRGESMPASGIDIYRRMEMSPPGAGGIVFTKTTIMENGVEREISHAYNVERTAQGVQFADDQWGIDRVYTQGENPFAMNNELEQQFAERLQHAFAFYPY